MKSKSIHHPYVYEKCTVTVIKDWCLFHILYVFNQFYSCKIFFQFDSPAVDIEKPKELSPNLVFIIFPQQFIAIGPEYVTNVTVPVHIRYHQPSSRYDTVQIQLKNPRLYLLCQGKQLFI